MTDSSSIKAPAIIDGFPAFAPNLAREGDGFRSEFYDNLAAAEDGHFWFKGRNRLIIWALRKYCPDLTTFLEVGCGTAYVLSGIAKAFPSANLSGSELFSAGLKFASERLPRASFMQMDARDIPFENAFDAIGAFDVIEHIQDDEAVLAQLYKALKPGGHLILTVPQHQWLWSQYDDFSCHFRRYTKRDLHSKIRAAGFDVVRSTSFVTTLLPAMMASRIMAGKIDKADYNAADELKISPLLNCTFEKLLTAEAHAIAAGVNLPVGGTRLLVARKVNKP